MESYQRTLSRTQPTVDVAIDSQAHPPWFQGAQLRLGDLSLLVLAPQWKLVGP